MESIEFGRKDTADAVREEHANHLDPEDDKRTKTVTLAPGTPDDVVEDVERRADQDRADAETIGPGQVDLTDREVDRIDFSEGVTSVPHAKSVKGIARAEGVDDWLAFFDPTLTVDEHREVMERAAADEQGQRFDVEDDPTEQAGEAAARVEGEECDHAAGHCEHGDADACEFLRNSCGYSGADVERILAVEDLDPDRVAEPEPQQRELVEVGEGAESMEVTPGEATALQSSWKGYRGAVGSLEDLVPEVRDEVLHGREAMQAINTIREHHGQDPLEPERLDALLARLADVPDPTTLQDFAGEGDVDVEPDPFGGRLPLPDTVGAYTKKRSINPDRGNHVAVYTGNGEVVRVHPVRTSEIDDPDGWWATRNDDVGTATAKGDRLARSQTGGVSFGEAVEAALDYMIGQSGPSIDRVGPAATDPDRFPRLRERGASAADRPGPVGAWEFETDTDQVAGVDRRSWRWWIERPRMEGGTQMVSVSAQSEDPDLWVASAGNIDRLERRTLAKGRDRDAVLAEAMEFVEAHPHGFPDWFLADEPDVDDPEPWNNPGGQETLGRAGQRRIADASEPGSGPRVDESEQVVENPGGLLADERDLDDTTTDSVDDIERQQGTLAGSREEMLRDRGQGGLDELGEED